MAFDTRVEAQNVLHANGLLNFTVQSVRRIGRSKVRVAITLFTSFVDRENRVAAEAELEEDRLVSLTVLLK